MDIKKMMVSKPVIGRIANYERNFLDKSAERKRGRSAF